jgi:tripartite-type tricarboxylate transporter receptor subunit TctC
LAYDPITSFEPMCLLAKVPVVVVVNSSSPYNSLSDLWQTQKHAPGPLMVGAFGPAAPPHIAEVSLKRVAQVDWTYVPFPGDAPAVTLYRDGTCGSAFAERLKRDYDFYGRVIREENIKAE